MQHLDLDRARDLASLHTALPEADLVDDMHRQDPHRDWRCGAFAVRQVILELGF